jgi:hypothetical protein
MESAEPLVRALLAALAAHETRLAEHEARGLVALNRMSKMVDTLVHDARGLHLDSARHVERLSILESEATELRERLDTLASAIASLRAP